MTTNTPTPQRLWTVRDVAEFAQCSISYAYKAAERGDLPCIRRGAMLRFDPEAVRRFFTDARPAAANP